MKHINWRRWFHRRIIDRDAANRSAKQDSTGQLHCDASMTTETQEKVRVLPQRKDPAKFIPEMNRFCTLVGLITGYCLVLAVIRLHQALPSYYWS